MKAYKPARPAYPLLIAGILAALLMAGCLDPVAPATAPPLTPTHLKTDTPPPPTISPSATETSSPTPTPSPTATPTPTPTPEPSERFEQANRFQHNGQYEEAIACWQTLLEDPAASPWRAEALYGLGQASLQAGRLDAAESAFRTFLADYPEHPHAGHARVWLAEALEQDGRPQEAIAVLEQYLSTNPPVADHILRWMGDLKLAAGDPAGAAELYAQAAQQAPTLSARALFLELRAQALLAAGDALAAAGQYEDILAMARNADYRAKIHYLAGQAWVEASQEDAAIEHFLAATQENPRSRYAHAALVELVDREIPFDEFQRGMIDYYNEAYWPAISAFQRYVEGEAPDEPDTAYYYMAGSYAAVGLTEEADATYRRLIRDFPLSRWFGEAWLARARLAENAGDMARAAELYLSFARQYADHPLADRALFARAELLEEQGRLESAAQAYRDLAEDYPDGTYATVSLHRAALCLYRLGRYQDAAEYWESIATGTGEEVWREIAHFWAGKCRLVLGEVDAAVSLLSDIPVQRPLEYYGVRARALLASVGAAPPTPVPADGSADVLDWLSDWTEIPPDEINPAIPQELEENAELGRALELLKIGLREEANAELDALRQAYADRPAHLYFLALMFRDEGLYRQSILAAERVITLAGLPLEQVPLSLGRLAYPTYYSDLVESEARTYGIDPLLIYAVIRQESLFEGQAESWAAAQGLMQVIPPTGEWIALQLQWPDFDPQDLYLPWVNVKFGIYYLHRQLQGFEGEVVSALAGYNAGPGNASRWRQAAGAPDPDLIYNVMDLSETRLYIERIFHHYAAYQLLWGD